jgi:hypothetical protein
VILIRACSSMVTRVLPAPCLPSYCQMEGDDHEPLEITKDLGWAMIENFGSR